MDSELRRVVTALFPDRIALKFINLSTRASKECYLKIIVEILAETSRE